VGALDAHWPDKGEPDAEQLLALTRVLEAQFGVAFDPTTPPFAPEGGGPPDKDAVGRFVLDRLLAVLAEKEQRWEALRQRYPQVGLISHRQLERDVLLRTLDRLWKDHLYAMDALRDGIRFRGYAQRDPKVEYAREGFALFEDMNQRIDAQVTEEVFKVWIDEARLEQASRSLPAAPAPPQAQGASAQATPAAAPGPRPAGALGSPLGPARGSRPLPTAGKPAAAAKVGRNDLCPCGSGKKFKRCCGA